MCVPGPLSLVPNAGELGVSDAYPLNEISIAEVQMFSEFSCFGGVKDQRTPTHRGPWTRQSSQSPCSEESRRHTSPRLLSCVSQKTAGKLIGKTKTPQSLVRSCGA